MGGALTAIAPDFTRAALGVRDELLGPAEPVGRLRQLRRIALEPELPDELERPLVLSHHPDALGPGRGERLRAPDDRRPAARHARPRGADERRLRRPSGDQLSRPTTRRGRSAPRSTPRSSTAAAGPASTQVWDVPRIANYPYADSAIVYWDSGPIRDDPDSADPADSSGRPAADREHPQPHRPGPPRACPRRTPEEQQMVSDFLRRTRRVRSRDTCTGGAGPACHDYTFGGTRAPGS